MISLTKVTLHTTKPADLLPHSYSFSTALDSLPAAPVAQVLPAIWQLHPEIRVCYEEDRLDLSSPGTDWVWLVVAGRVYLVTPARQVWHSASATSLLRHVYLRNGQGRAV